MALIATNAIALLLTVLAPSETPARLPNGILSWKTLCRELLFQPRGPYQTVMMSPEFFVFDALVTNYVPSADLPSKEVVYDRESESWVYKLSRAAVASGSYMFAMNESGGLFIIEDYVSTWGAAYHHSSIFQGGRVAAAGTLVFDKSSNLKMATDETGHYYRGFRVRCRNWQQLFKELRHRGVNIGQIEIWERRSGRIGQFQRFYLSDPRALDADCSDLRFREILTR